MSADNAVGFRYHRYGDDRERRRSANQSRLGAIFAELRSSHRADRSREYSAPIIGYNRLQNRYGLAAATIRVACPT